MATMIPGPDSELKVGAVPDGLPEDKPIEADTQLPNSMTFEQLSATHHLLNLKRVRQLQAMYKGGQALLDNPEVMKSVFPKYGHETDDTYKERCARAFYENMFALVINQISAGLAQDPAKFEEPPADEYWNELLTEATAPDGDGSRTRSFDQICRDNVVEGLVTGWGWLQCELPEAPNEELGDALPTSEKEQEDSGALEGYLIQWPTDQVTDWAEEKNELIWLKTYQIEYPRPMPHSPKEVRKHIWTVWTQTEWKRYEYTEDKQHQFPPGAKVEILSTGEGTHSFEAVPWIRFDVSGHGGTSLWIGDVIESLCRNYFNRQNGEAFQWVQYNYQQLYEFLGPEVMGVDTMISEAQTDPGRASRRRAPGKVHVRGADDRAEFVAPDMGGADVGQKAIQELRDAILRITAQMALAQDTSGAMLRRSGDSKRQDSVAQEIVLGAIGKRVVVMMNKVRELLAIGRGDDPEEIPRLLGYERFNVMDLESLTAQDLSIEAMDIPSATFQVERKYQLACTRLGDSISDDVRQKIREELEGAITQDQLTAPPPGFDEDGNPLAPVGPDGEVVDPAAEEENPFAKEPEGDEPFPPKKGAAPFPPKGGKGKPPLPGKKPGGNPFAK